MAPGLSGVAVLVLCATISACVFAWDNECKSYRGPDNKMHSSQECTWGYCCGACNNRYCCTNNRLRLSDEAQDECDSRFMTENLSYSYPPMIIGIIGFILLLLVLICCCICPCCCIYKMCRKPQPVIATTTHTTVVTSAPQQYPQQPTSVPGHPQQYQAAQYPQQPTSVPGHPQPYQAAQYPPYQPMPIQPGYGTHPMPTTPYKGQPFTPGPPPPYQEAIGPAYPPQQPMPYSQAAYNPGQPAYPLQPPIHPQPNAPPSHADFQAQPAYNPDYVIPPTTG